MTAPRKRRLIMWVLAGGVALFVLSVRLLPLALPSVPAETRADFTYQADDGAEHVYLHGDDSYLWARHARNYLQQGTTCDAVARRECRDTYANAPLGARMVYQHSLHIAAIVGLHRLLTAFDPGFPLLTSTYFVSVVIGVLGVFPAFFIGWRLAGTVGALFASLLSAAYPEFLARSIGGDNDVWNVVLPMFMMWAAVEAWAATGVRGRIGWAALSGVIVGLQAATWSGWPLSYLIVLTGLGALTVLAAARQVLTAPEKPMWRDPAVRRGVLILLAFWITAGVATWTAGAERSAFAAPWQLAPAPAPADSALWPSMFGLIQELQRAPFAEFIARQHGAFFVALSLAGLLLLVVRVFGGKRLPTIDRGAALLTIVWYVAACALCTRGYRFHMFLAPPVAFTLAVAAQHASLLLERLVTARAPAARTPARIARVALLAVLLFVPLRLGVQVAQQSVPRMTDAWWETLTDLRVRSAPDAILNIWADYGHWAKYAAERRVTGDGATLSTHVHYWLGRALATPSEAQSIGLLRMLDCGSDATPLREGKHGAYARVLLRVRDAVVAHDLVTALVSLDERKARAVLKGRAFSLPEQDAVLAASHCTPPDAYLVVSADQFRAPGGWLHLGLFNFRTQQGPDEALITPDWIPCRTVGDAAVCTGALPLGDGRVLEEVRFDAKTPLVTSLRLRSSGTGEWADGTPALVMVAGAERRQETRPPGAAFPTLGVVLDTVSSRALVGSTVLLRSQFFHLMYLDGRYSTSYEKTSERTSSTGDRVVTWKIRWP